MSIMVYANQMNICAEQDCTYDFSPKTCNPYTEDKYECRITSPVAIFDFTNADVEPDNNYEIYYELPIMIQARWHKNKRIRKKWLKRYGLKPDVVTAKCQANMIDVTYMEDGAVSVECTPTNFEILWKPCHRRRGIKIEC